VSSYTSRLIGWLKYSCLQGGTLKLPTKILLAFIGLLVVAVALIPLFVNANTFRPGIERQLTIILGRSVKLGDLSLSLFSGSLIAKELRISDDPEFSAAPFLTANGVRIGIWLRPLIVSHQVRIRSFQVESPQIHVIRAANGRWNFSSISPLASYAATGISKDTARELSYLSVDRIVIQDGRAEIASLTDHGQSHVYEHVDLTVRNFSFASQFPFALKMNLPADGALTVVGHGGPINQNDVATSPTDAQISANHFDPVASGFLDPNAGLSFLADADIYAAFDGQKLVSRGMVRLQNLKLRKGAPVARKTLDFYYDGAHRLKENDGLIKDASAKIGHGAIHVSGAYSIGVDVANPLLNLKLAAQNLHIDDIQPLMTAAAIRLPNGSALKGGRLSMNLGITGRLKSLVINGPIALDNTQLVGFDIGSKIHGIAARSGVKTGATTDFEKLRVNVLITNAGVSADEIDAVIPAMGELTGSGTVSAADQLDFNLIVKVASAKGIGKIGVSLLAKLNGSDKASAKDYGVPLRVIGTPDNPYITADVGGVFHRKIKAIASAFRKKQ